MQTAKKQLCLQNLFSVRWFSITQPMLGRSPQCVHSFSAFLRISNLMIPVEMQAHTDDWIFGSGNTCGFLPGQIHSHYSNLYVFVFLHNESIVCPKITHLPGLALAAWHVWAHTGHSYLQEPAKELMDWVTYTFDVAIKLYWCYLELWCALLLDRFGLSSKLNIGVQPPIPKKRPPVWPGMRKPEKE